jgi:adenine-specific DNA methylase
MMMNALTNAQLSGSSPNGRDDETQGKRAIEVGFPIVEINRLAVPERNSFKPIYQMHKWFARRASCVFRAILLGVLKPAIQNDGTPTDLMDEFYKDHSDDPDTTDKVILDPFMGGGTTVVEALRLGCRVIGNDLNPVAWFIVKTEVEPIDLEALKDAFERLAARSVVWNDGRPLRETLLSLYKTDVAEGIEADAIYTFWVKSAICTDPNCCREVPLFTDYIITQNAPSIRYYRDAICPACHKTFDWEVELASLIADPMLKEMLLCAFSATLNNSNMFSRYHRFTHREGKIEGVFARHDFQPKTTSCESNVWGVVHGYGAFIHNFAKLVEGKQDFVWPAHAHLSAANAATIFANSFTHVVTDPPYVGNVNYSELADFFYVWLRIALKDSYPHFAPEYTPKVEEIVENSIRKKTRNDFFEDLQAVFQRAYKQLPDDGLAVFTFHHTDQEGKVWEGLLEALCESGFEVVAVYPIHAESETSLHLMNKENISYDLIHVCRKRKDDPPARSWAGVRQEVRRKAREELQAIELGRYGNQPLPKPDVRLICIGKCLELYSAHYGKVLDHENKPLPLHKALQDISAIVDQLVTKDRPLPSELEAVDGLSYVWLRVLAPIRNEVMMDAISKAARAMQVSVDDLKEAGLVVRGRTGRGRTYEVKQPVQRLGDLLAQYQPGLKVRTTQGELFTSEGETIFYDIPLVFLWGTISHE